MKLGDVTVEQLLKLVVIILFFPFSIFALFIWYLAPVVHQLFNGLCYLTGYTIGLINKHLFFR